MPKNGALLVGLQSNDTRLGRSHRTRWSSVLHSGRQCYLTEPRSERKTAPARGSGTPDETFSTPARGSGTPDETFFAPARHGSGDHEIFIAHTHPKCPISDHFHRAGAIFLSQRHPTRPHDATQGRSFFHTTPRSTPGAARTRTRSASFASRRPSPRCPCPLLARGSGWLPPLSRSWCAAGRWLRRHNSSSACLCAGRPWDNDCQIGVLPGTDRSITFPTRYLAGQPGTKLALHGAFLGQPGTKLAQHAIKHRFSAIFRALGEFSHAQADNRPRRAKKVTPQDPTSPQQGHHPPMSHAIRLGEVSTTSENVGIPTIKIHGLKESWGNCMRN